jgi:hypothetical protein
LYRTTLVDVHAGFLSHFGASSGHDIRVWRLSRDPGRSSPLVIVRRPCAHAFHIRCSRKILARDHHFNQDKFHAAHCTGCVCGIDRNGRCEAWSSARALYLQPIPEPTTGTRPLPRPQISARCRRHRTLGKFKPRPDRNAANHRTRCSLGEQFYPDAVRYPNGKGPAQLRSFAFSPSTCERRHSTYRLRLKTDIAYVCLHDKEVRQTGRRFAPETAASIGAAKRTPERPTGRFLDDPHRRRRVWETCYDSQRWAKQSTLLR